MGVWEQSFQPLDGNKIAILMRYMAFRFCIDAFEKLIARIWKYFD